MFSNFNRYWMVLVLCAIPPFISAQENGLGLPFAPSEVQFQSLEGFNLAIETIATDIGPLADADLTGFSCYQIFITTNSSTDQVSAVFGNADSPMSLLTTGQFFQSFPLGDITSQGVLEAAWPLYPSNAYDSYVTIGIDGPADLSSGEGAIQLLQSSSDPWQNVFEPGGGLPGNGFALTDAVGGSWFTLPSQTNGIAGSDQRVLLAQLTTDGILHGNMQVQLFLNGDNLNGAIYLDLALPVPGCTDPMACNYLELATEDDGSCASVDACGICGGAGEVLDCGCTDIPEGDCDCDGNQLDALGVCGGNCAADLDADGICDDVDDCIGQPDACGICNGPGAIFDCGCDNIPSGDCDCEGNQLDALEVCGGDCAADLDTDGICDDVDDCIGEPDACGICNGPGAIFDCGCDNIPSGDCDCEGNQLDALGVCGGDCAADLDADGICDDVDDCVGEPDACGVCNGPGTIYDCGCTDIPDQDCDCNGNQLDALGVCGGDCAADLDADGICDTDEVPGCTDEAASNFNPEATDDDGTCLFSGCTDPEADNFSPLAGDDDGSCAYTCVGIRGCTYPDATNFTEDAICDDGSCTFLSGPPDENCPFDMDGNGIIGSADLIVFLSYYQLPCSNGE